MSSKFITRVGARSKYFLFAICIPGDDDIASLTFSSQFCVAFVSDRWNETVHKSRILPDNDLNRQLQRDTKRQAKTKGPGASFSSSLSCSYLLIFSCEVPIGFVLFNVA